MEKMADALGKKGPPLRKDGPMGRKGLTENPS